MMAASGHKTMNVFKRYNTVTDEELKRLVSGTMDTYVDTNRKGVSQKNGQPLDFMVGQGGVEPPTLGFSVRCSTD